MRAVYEAARISRLNGRSGGSLADLLGRTKSVTPVFGILLGFSRESGRTFTEPLRAYMQALGYAEGRNIVFEVRYADGRADRLPGLAADLVALRPNVIATFGDASGLAAKAATSTVPIVSMSEDLVKAKLVTSINHPGSNITGVSIMGTELDAKRLEILAEFLPARSAVLLLSDQSTHRGSRPALEATAAALGLHGARSNRRLAGSNRAIAERRQRERLPWS